MNKLLLSIATLSVLASGCKTKLFMREVPEELSSVDTSLPQVSIVVPAAGSYINLASVNPLVVGGTCSENGRAVSVVATAGGVVTASPICTGGFWNTTINFTTLTDGVVAFTADHSSLSGVYASTANRNITKDRVAPTQPTVTTTTATGVYGTGSVINFTINFSESVTVSAGAFVSLNTTPAKNATCAAGTGTSTLCTYTVQAGDSSARLNYSNASSLSGTIRDAAGNDYVSALPSTGSGNDDLYDNNIVIDTVAPIAATALSWTTSSPSSVTGVTASWTPSTSLDLASQSIQFYSDSTCTGVSGSAIALTSAANTRAFTGVNGTTYTYKISSIDLAGNATVSGCSSSMLIDTTAPTITSVTTTTTTGTYGTGSVINVTVNFSESVVVTGSPTITLNTTPSRTAVCTNGTGASVSCSYTVVASDAATRLTYSATTSLSGGTIRDAANNNAVLTLPATTSNGLYTTNIIIDTAALNVTVNQIGPQADPTRTLPITYAVVFSKAINAATFDTSDITQNGTATVTGWNLVDSGDHINFTLTATTVTTNGTVTPSIAINRVQDPGAGNNNVSTSTDNSVIYDTGLPVAVTGWSMSPSGVSNNNTPTFSGTGEGGAVLRVYSAAGCATQIATTTITNTGGVDDLPNPSHTFTTPASSVLADGTYNFYYNIIDVAGNALGCTATGIAPYTVNTSTPAAPTSIIRTVPLARYDVDSTPSFTVNHAALPANIANVVIYNTAGCPVGSPVASTAGVAASTATNVTVPALTNATATTSYYARIYDTAGNYSSCIAGVGTAAEYQYDNATPALATAWSMNPANGSTSSDTTPVLTSTGEPAATVKIFGEVSCTTQIGTTTIAGSGDANPNTPLTAISVTPTTAADGLYHFYYTLTDIAGNPTACTDTGMSYTLNTTTPTVAITLPVALSYINTLNSGAFTVSGTCSEDGRTVSVSAVGGATVSATPTCGSTVSHTWSTTMNLSGLTDGTVVITANHDNAALTAATASVVNYNKETIIPTVSISAPTYLGSDPASASDSVTYALTFSDANPTAITDATVNAAITINGSNTNCTKSTTHVGYVATVTITGCSASSGTASITVNTGAWVDVAGNPLAATTGPSATFNILNSAPSIAISTPADNTWINKVGSPTDATHVNDSATFAVTGTCTSAVQAQVNGQTIYIKIDGGAFVATAATCTAGTFTTSIDTTGLSAGAHTITARVTDTLAITGTSSVTNLTKDIINPTVVIAGPGGTNPANASATTTYTLTFSDVNLGTLSDATINAGLTLGGATTGCLTTTTHAANVATVSITGCSGNGNVNLSVTASAWSDLGINPLTAVGPSSNFLVNNDTPAMAITSPATNSWINKSGSTVDATHINDSATFALSGTCTETTQSQLNGQTIYVKIDAGAFTATAATCTAGTFSTSIDTTGLSAGAHTISVRATDLASNVGTSATITLTKDVINPTLVITGPGGATTAGATDSTTYTLTFSDTNIGTLVDATINAGITINGNNTGCTKSTTHVGAVATVTITGCSSATGTASITVNASAWSDLGLNPLTAVGPSSTFTIANAAPAIAILVPANNTWINKSGSTVDSTHVNDAANVTVSGTCTGAVQANVNGQTIYLKVDGGAFTATAATCTAGTFSATMDTTGLSAGAHTITARVTDTLAIDGTSSVINLTRDVTNPTVVIAGPGGSNPASSTGSTTYTFTFSDTNLATINDTTVNNAITINGTNTGCTKSTTHAGAVATVTITNCSGDGVANVSISAAAFADLALNPLTAAGPSSDFTVANSLPVLAITDPLTNSYINSYNNITNLEYQGTCTGAVQARVDGRDIYIQVDSGAWILLGTCSSGTFSAEFDVFTNVPVGTHTIRVRLTDTAGSVGYSPTITVIKDITLPTVSSVTTTTATGSYGTASVINVTINMSESVTVTGSPVVALNTTPARNATCTNGTGTSISCSYTVQANDAALRLDYTATTSFTGGAVADAAGNLATRTLPATATSGLYTTNIKINTLPAPTAIALQTPTAIYGKISQPTFRITHAALPSGVANVNVYSDATCATLVGTLAATLNATNSSVQLTAALSNQTSPITYYTAFVDSVGGKSTCVGSQQYQYDNVLPVAVTGWGMDVTNGSGTYNHTIKFSGSAEGASTIGIYPNSSCSAGEILGSITVAGTGDANPNIDTAFESSITIASDGTYAFYYRIRDIATNATACTTTGLTITIDTPDSLATPDMASKHYAHTAHEIIDGNGMPRVMVIGGIGSAAVVDNKTDLYTPDASQGVVGTWNAGPEMKTVHAHHASIVLADGSVLVAGGENISGGSTTATEICEFTPGDPDGKWSLVAPMNFARRNATMVLLPNTRVLIFGGIDDSGFPVREVEEYDPGTQTWVVKSSYPLGAVVSGMRAANILDGSDRVMIAGGTNGASIREGFFLHTPAMSWNAADMSIRRNAHGLVSLNGGNVFAGGSNDTADLTAEIFDNITNTWSQIADMQYHHTINGTNEMVTYEGNRKVVMAGGEDSSLYWHSYAEVFNFSNGHWEVPKKLIHFRKSHTVTAMSNGDLLIVGGTGGTNTDQSAELLTPP